ncbi:hypothetical protein [Sphingomonas sp. MMS24-J13]|uniref:hypothetical protein n=1 Tax=Sphingomonas sp. MMS24-J13 TaxID=3238686 RepID=UPI00384E9DCD
MTAIPRAAIVFSQTFDPKSILPYQHEVSRVGDPDASTDPESLPILAADETIDTFELVPSEEALEKGLYLLDTAEYFTTISDRTIQFWPAIQDDRKNDPLFTPGTVRLSLDLTFTTTATPPNVWHYTLVLKVGGQ